MRKQQSSFLVLSGHDCGKHFALWRFVRPKHSEDSSQFGEQGQEEAGEDDAALEAWLDSANAGAVPLVMGIPCYLPCA